MLDVLGWTPLSQKRQDARLILFYKLINSLAQVPFEGVFVEAYKSTRRKHNIQFRQIGHTTSQYGQSVFSLKLLVHGTGLLSLKVRHWLNLDQIFLTISVHPFRIILRLSVVILVLNLTKADFLAFNASLHYVLNQVNQGLQHFFCFAVVRGIQLLAILHQ